jgi:uncharacterized membrane protein YhaH (DUF805 family)
VPFIPSGQGRRLPAWALQLALTLVAVALALGGAALLSDRQWIGGTVLFGLAMLAALIAALIRKPSANHR